MTAYLGNAFSLNMLEIGTEGVQVEIQPVQPSDIPAGVKSIIGHEDMAIIVSVILGCTVQANRESVTLKEGDVLFVAQYRGQRLPAGTTQLPVDVRMEFYRIISHAK